MLALLQEKMPQSPLASSASRVGLRTRRTLACAFGGLGLGIVVSAGAAAEAYNPENLPAQQLSQVNAICRNVVGLEPGERAFVDCVESLSRSAAKLGGARALARARHDCLAKGLPAGGAELSECEVAATDDNSAPTAVAPQAAKVVQPPAAKAKSYFYASWREAHQRHRMACAALGYDPAGAGFYNCVAGLQAALFRAEHPST